MKRSEMIKIMLDAYNEFCSPIQHISPNYKMPKLTPADVGFILLKMEEAGMLPPPYANTQLGNHMDFYEINEWEPEIEEEQK